MMPETSNVMRCPCSSGGGTVDYTYSTQRSARGSRLPSIWVRYILYHPPCSSSAQSSSLLFGAGREPATSAIPAPGLPGTNYVCFADLVSRGVKRK